MRIRLGTSVLLLLAVLSLVTARGEDRARAGRAVLALDRWETARAPRGGAPVGKFAPGASRLPFLAQQEDVLVRTVADVPAALASHALAVELERVRWDASVSLDGKVIATGLEGDASVDLPPVSEGKHEILIRARDVRAAAVAGRRATDDDAVDAGWFLPVGKAPRQAGLLGDARIVERLPVDLVSVHVALPAGASSPELVLDLAGRTGEPCEVGFVCSGSQASGKTTVSLARGDRTRVAFSWPDAPRAGTGPLAEVQVEIAGKLVRTEHLAARSVAVRDGRLVQDGAPLPFFVLDAPPGDGDAAAREAVKRARAAGANVLATGGRRDRAWLERVRVEGLLVLMETDLGPPLSALAIEDERFWAAFRRDAIAMVERERGNVAIVAWGLARGLLREGGGGSRLVRERIAALGEEVRALDGSRPVVLPHDDARSLGFSPAWTLPRLAPEAESARGLVVELPETALDLAGRVALAGDPGFLDANAVAVAHARERARAALAARAAGALGIDLGAPPESTAGELARALEPLALVPVPARGGGERSLATIERKLSLVSDLPADADVAVMWSFTIAGKGVASGKIDRHVARGTVLPLAIGISLPSVKTRQEANLHVEAHALGRQATVEIPLAIWPARAPALRSEKRILLLDGPDGQTGDALLEAGVAWREAPATPEDLDRESTLIVGEGALDEKESRARGIALVERARRSGAGVLVLRQTTPYPDGLAPPIEGQEPRGARELAFRDPHDAFLAGFAQDDLARWPGADGALPPPGLVRPIRADARVLIEGAPCGTTESVGVVAVLDARAPELLCQIPLAARVRELPAARALLAALVRAVGESPAPKTRPFFARVDPEVEPGLEQLALVPRPWSLEAIERSEDAVILRDDAKLPALSPDEQAALERAVANGATLLFRATDQSSLARLGNLAPPSLKIEKAQGLPQPGRNVLGTFHATDLLWPPAPGALRDVTSRYDTASLQASGPGTFPIVEPGALVERPFGRGRVLVDLVRWREAAPQLPAARRWFSQVFQYLGAETHEPPIRLPVNVWGGVGRRGDVVYFASNATAQARFFARRAGRYKVHVELGGTKALGGWPIARVVCDARFLGDVTLDGPGPRSYELEVTLPAGTHVLSVSFTNDVYEPPEDRDMMLKGAVLEYVAPRVY